MPYNLSDPRLKIYASDGILSVNADGLSDRIGELPLNKLERVYSYWQHLIKRFDANVTQVWINDKQKRDELIRLFRRLGFKHPHRFTGSQVEALLFFYDSGPSILWRFHSVYPVLDLPDTSSGPEINFRKHIGDLDPFETAQLYLIQSDSIELAESMSLSKVMKLFTSKAFISWASDPKNRERLEMKEFKEKLKENPINPEDIKALMRGER